MKLKDVSVKDGNWTQISLAKLTGQKIKDIQGYITNSDWDATFIVTRIVFENGNTLLMGGEHDMPFIDDEDAELNMDTDTLEDLYSQQEEEDDDL